MQDGAAETELLLKAARGDEVAFLLLYERHRTPVFRFACRMLGSATQAEDVTQECFLQVIRRPEAFRAERASLRLRDARRRPALRVTEVTPSPRLPSG